MTTIRPLFNCLPITFSIALCLLTFGLKAQEMTSLKPARVIQLKFADLPTSLHHQKINSKAPPIATIRLPNNYTANKKFPLFAFLPGGNGDNGTDLSTQRHIAGKKDYILVSLPLFQTNPKSGSLLVTSVDYPVISKAYSKMLQKIHQLVPNIDSNNGILGGYSNGAHTTAQLLNFSHKETFDSFNHFFLLDGGQDFHVNLGGNYNRLSESNILFVYGGKASENDKIGSLWRQHTVLGFELLEIFASGNAPGFIGTEGKPAEKWKFVKLADSKHSPMSDYLPELKKWVTKLRGELDQ